MNGRARALRRTGARRLRIGGMVAAAILAAVVTVLQAREVAATPSVLSYTQLPSSGQDYDTEPEVAVDPTNSSHIAVGFMRRVNNTDLVATQCWVATSTDGGSTWNEQQLGGDSERNCADMSVAFAPNGTIYATRVAYIGSDVGDVFMHTSTDGGTTWSGPSIVLQGITDKLGIDRPWVLVDRSSASAHKGNVYVVAKSAFFDYVTPHVYFKRSTDGGQTWGATQQIDAQPYPGEYRLMENAALASDGTILISYRSKPSGCGNYCYTAAVSTDGGQTFTLRPMPAPNYPNGITDTDETFPAVVAGDPNTAGRFAAMWLSNFGGNEVDVAASITADGGQTWSAPVKVNDGVYPAGAIQDHPWLAWGGNGELYASWRDRRNDSSQSSTAPWDLYASVSTDAGVTWAANLRLSATQSPATPEEAGNDFIGVGDVPDGSAWSAWSILTGSGGRQVWLAHWSG